MSDTNRIFISGNVVEDAKLTRDQQGQVVYFQITSTRVYKEGNAWKEKECFIEVELYDNLAARYAPHLKKGQKVTIEGYLKEIELERRLTYAIHANSLLLIQALPVEAGKAKESGNTAATSSASPEPQAEEKPRGENDVLKRLAADVGQPPPQDAPYEE
jgi:single stranded DNA-binding protein